MRALALTVLLAAAPAHGEDLAVDLARARLDVDELSARLRDARRVLADDLAALRAERAELQRQLGLERVRAETLARLAAERRARATGVEDETAAWRAPILAMLEEAKRHVGRALPYQIDERRGLLERLERDLDAAHPDLAAILARLLRFVEEEEALGRTAGRSRQAIAIGEERVLAEVLHVGMAAMYFRAPDGRVGHARATGEAYRFEIAPPEAEAAVLALFEAAEHNRLLGPQRLLLEVRR